MDQSSFHFHEKKRVVVKIGSSSLNYEETGSLNFTKLEHLVRELCNLRNRGMDLCLVSSGAIAVGRQSLGMTERPRELSTKQAASFSPPVPAMFFQKRTDHWKRLLFPRTAPAQQSLLFPYRSVDFLQIQTPHFQNPPDTVCLNPKA